MNPPRPNETCAIGVSLHGNVLRCECAPDATALECSTTDMLSCSLCQPAPAFTSCPARPSTPSRGPGRALESPYPARDSNLPGGFTRARVPGLPGSLRRYPPVD